MKFVDPPHPSSGHYAPAVITKSGLVFVSGQSSVDPFTHQVTQEGIGAEMKVSLTRIVNILKNAGIDRTHIVMCKVYITDMKGWDEANAAYAEFFGEHKPARAIYETARTHHGGHIEIEAVAEL